MSGSFHVVDLPVCGGRVWCHTRLTHDEQGQIDDALLDTIPDAIKDGDLARVQKLARGGGKVIDLPPSLVSLGREAQKRQRIYSEIVVGIVTDHWVNLKTRDGAEIPDKAKALLGTLDAEDFDALIAGCTKALEVGRADPRAGSPTSSDGPSPAAVSGSQPMPHAI